MQVRHERHTHVAGYLLHAAVGDKHVGSLPTHHRGEDGQGTLEWHAHALVSAIHGDVRACLNLGHSGIGTSRGVRASTASADDANLYALLPTVVSGTSQQLQRDPCSCGA